MTDIFVLSDRLTDELAALDPILATEAGVEGYNDRWPDLSPEGVQMRQRFWADALTQAKACQSNDRRSHVAKEVLIGECKRNLADYEAGRYRFDLNSIASPWQAFRDVFDLVPTDSASAWEDIVSRLTSIGEGLRGYRESLQVGLDAGEPVARRQVEAAIEQGRVVAGDQSSLNEILVRFDETHVGPGNSQLRSEIDQAVQSAKNQFAKMTSWLTDTYLPRARQTDVVGRQNYVAAAESFLGDALDPDDAYQWGWQEIARLQARLDALCAEIDPSLDTTSVIELLKSDPDRAATDIDAYVEFMQARQVAALEALNNTHFDVDERYATVEVKVASPGGSLAPYYVPPSEDFSRPGCVWYPISHNKTFPLFADVTTNYHEGFPGHHLQCGWQVAMGDELSRFHKQMIWYPGSGEGWALYAEHLMDELGFLEKPEYQVGLLLSQLLRACRIVIDIGSHCEIDIPSDTNFHPGQAWTYELGTEMLREIAFQPADMADSEVTRYLGWPGQAISYKLGEKAILDLRAERSKAKDFNLKAFHSSLLSVGSIRLDLLRELV